MDERLHRGLRDLAADHDLLALYAFGSRAAEVAARLAGPPAQTEHPGSDIDIGVEPRRGRMLSARDRVRIMQRLEDLLQVARVDLVPLLREEWHEKVGAEL